MTQPAKGSIEAFLEQIIKEELLNREKQGSDNVQRRQEEKEVPLFDLPSDNFENSDFNNEPGVAPDVGRVQVTFGTAWVSGGVIQVKGLPERDVLPTITPCTGVTLYINGKKVTKKTAVSELDHIEVECRTVKIPAQMSIEYAEDLLAAYLKIQLERNIKHVLVDQPEQKNLVLRTEVVETTCLPYSSSDIFNFLNDSGIKFGLDYRQIQQILENPADGKYKVAEGEKPVPPVDDYVAVLFQENPIRPNEQEAGKIDFKQKIWIPSVEKDAVLAVRRPGTPGLPGTSVFGDPVMPREKKTINIKAGKGTSLAGNGDTVVATRPGRPRVRRGRDAWLFTVEDCLIIYNNIDINTGHQFFKGSIKVYGNVEDGMKIRAGGALMIAGYCSRADVVAMEHVWVKSIIGSSVQAGVKGKYFRECQMTLYDLKQQLNKLIQALEQVQARIRESDIKVRAGYLALVIIEKFFPDIPKLLGQTLHYFRVIPVELPEFTSRMLQMIEQNLPPRDLTAEKIKDIVEAISQTESYYFDNTSPADISAEYVLQSRLSCTGNINILGQGCYISELNAGNNVLISGFVRGGRVTAANEITVGEAGSKAGAPTLLKTTEKGRITVLHKAYEGTTFVVGGAKKTLPATTQGRMTVFLRNNELVVAGSDVSRSATVR